AYRAEDIPAVAERIGREWNDVLALREQINEIVREVIGDRDRHEREDEALRDLPCRQATGDRAHERAHRDVGAEQDDPEREETGGPDGGRSKNAPTRQEADETERRV